MGRSRYKVLGEQPHFITCTTVRWTPVFSRPDLAQAILDSLRFLHQRQRLVVYSYVIMENHLHLVASAENLSKAIGNFKSFTARTIVDRLRETPGSYLLEQLRMGKLPHKTGQTHQLWQEGFHPQAILTEEMLLQKLEYIHNNPVKRGYVDDPAHWRYSSYRNYIGQPGLLDVEILT